MYRSQLVARSLSYHWRIHLPVLAGVALATAILTGALLVGDSLRGSLRTAALDRLGRVERVIQAPNFCRAALADDLAVAGGSENTTQCAPLILSVGSATHAETHAAAHGVNVIGVDARFWEMRTLGTPVPPAAAAHGVILNGALAAQLRAAVGDDVLVRLQKPTAIPGDTLLGRRDDATATLRLTVTDIVPQRGVGAFTLNVRQARPQNGYISLDTLQRALERRERVNTILLAGNNDPPLKAITTLADLGLRLRSSTELGYVALESEAFLLPAAAETAGREAASALNCRVSGILTYLANRITVSNRTELFAPFVPYSAVAALDGEPGSQCDFLPLAAGQILLNDWAARELDAHIGDAIQMSYYVAEPLGRMHIEAATFSLRGVVPLGGCAADPGLTPEYPGVTNAQSLAEWNPPFPIDLAAIRPQDEAYWRQYRATPKAFITLADGERLWATGHERFGRLTALRLHVSDGTTVTETQAALERELRARLDPIELGWRVDELRTRALEASAGTTDFSGLLLGFSFFLIISAVLLVALLFRLNTERRAAEIGLLLAVGFTPGSVRRLLLVEGVVLGLAGALVGLPLARLYAELLLACLRLGWSAALDLPLLALHATWSSFAIGGGGSALIAVLALGGALRGLVRRSCRELLSGLLLTEVVRLGRKGSRGLIGGAVILALGGLLATGWSWRAAAAVQAIYFFAAGAACLGAVILALAAWLRIDCTTTLRPGVGSMLRLGVRNARRHPGRSLLTASLMAAATFVLVALQVMRVDVSRDVTRRDSGTGGYALWVDADVSLHADLNTHAGRTALNLSSDADAVLGAAQFFPLRVHAGDEISCRSLTRPTQPRVLGVPDALIERRGFAFADTLARTPDERRNPWTLLHRTLPDGGIPAIADEASARWQLHVNLGDELPVTDEHGRTLRLRLVALLRGSIFQDALLVGQANFVEIFPSVDGYGLFLVAAPTDRVRDIEATLERELSDHGLAITSTAARLAEFGAVQNTYLATFQMLGGLGLLLGVVGLAVVLLRNVGERRAELALLLTLGFAPGRVGWMLLAENGLLVATGLVGGLLSAAVAVLPQMLARGTAPPWAMLLLMLAAVVAGGLMSAGIAVRIALRARLLPALRSE